MNKPIQPPRSSVDVPTLMALSAIAISINVAFHEGTHALACVGLGGELKEYSALHVACEIPTLLRHKIEAGAASIANLGLGTLCFFLLRSKTKKSPSLTYFLWLFMLMNWLFGSGYWMFSGAANIGDWAVVMEGWEPHWAARGGMFILGTLCFMFCVRLALLELGKFIGGTMPEQIGRATKMGLISYFTAVLVTMVAAFFNPYGILGLPATAGTSAALGALSPLLWMMQWFRSPRFHKREIPALEIERNWWIIIGGVFAVFLYGVVLGRTLYF